MAVKRTVSENPNAARDHLANERTLLAWIRTGIAVVALGFVVSKFGLLLRELGLRSAERYPIFWSTILGTILVVLGAILVIAALGQYLRTARQIERNEYRFSPALSVVATLLFVLAAVILAVYVLLTGLET